MMTDDEVNKARAIVGVVMGMFLIYLVAAAGNVVPDDYNVFKIFEEEQEPILADGIGYVVGIPTSVNVTAQANNSIAITFGCNESYIDGMEITIDPSSHFDNSTIYFTATSTDWTISDDGLSALYVGEPLTNGVEIGSLVLHVDGMSNETGDVDGVITTTVGTLDVEEFTFSVDIYEAV